MKKLNKRGFTLIELLAVTIILLIIFVIAFNALDDVSKKSKIKSVKANGLSYFKTADEFANVSKGDVNEIVFGKFTVDELDSMGVKVSGKKPDSGFLLFEGRSLACGCLKYGKYIIKRNLDGSTTSPQKGTCNFNAIDCSLGVGINNSTVSLEYTGAPQFVRVENSGLYKIELWGAQGGSTTNSSGGKGAYTSGLITLSENDVLYFYVGGKGTATSSGVSASIAGGYNGGAGTGGQNCCGRQFGTGGGATDVRLVNGDPTNFDSLKSRIMVAAGGGGAYYGDNGGWKANDGGYGGALIGGDGSQGADRWCHGLGATQTSGGAQTTDCGQTTNGAVTGKFGYCTTYDGAVTGGGGGYYGGSRSYHIASAGGGSSFISGYTGCDAITEDSTSDNIVHTGQPNHYSGKVFTNAVMKAGNQSMPTHDGKSTMTGNSGDGYAVITYMFDQNYDD